MTVVWWTTVHINQGACSTTVKNMSRILAPRWSYSLKHPESMERHLFSPGGVSWWLVTIEDRCRLPVSLQQHFCLAKGTLRDFFNVVEGVKIERKIFHDNLRKHFELANFGVTTAVLQLELACLWEPGWCSQLNMLCQPLPLGNEFQTMKKQAGH